MAKDKKRKERSRTPEVRWELLPPANAVESILPEKTKKDNDRRRDEAVHRRAPVRGEAAQKTTAEKLAEQAWAEKAAAEAASAAAESVGVGNDDGRARAEEAREAEKASWRNVVILLAALRGDPKTEALIKEKHSEFVNVARWCGAGGPASLTLSEAKESTKGWFARNLRGSNRQGPAARAAILDKLAETFEERVNSLRNTGVGRAAQVLEEGPVQEEGPLICSLLSRELEGSRFDGLFIAQEGRGIYRFGDDDEGSRLPATDQEGARIYRPRVVVKVAKSQLLIDGFYHEGESVLNPAKVPIGVFLGVYFEGLSLKEANNRWVAGLSKEVAAPTQRPNSGLDGRALTEASRSRSPPPSSREEPTRAEQDSIRALAETLPLGWELRESRSKNGVFYYANEKKGLSQLERPRA